MIRETRWVIRIFVNTYPPNGRWCYRTAHGSWTSDILLARKYVTPEIAGEVVDQTAGEEVIAHRFNIPEQEEAR